MCTWEKREDQNGVKEEQRVVRDSAVGCHLDSFVCGKCRWSRDRGWLICTYMSKGLLCKARARRVQEGEALTLSVEDGLHRGREGRDAREELQRSTRNARRQSGRCEAKEMGTDGEGIR